MSNELSKLFEIHFFDFFINFYCVLPKHFCQLSTNSIHIDAANMLLLSSNFQNFRQVFNANFKLDFRISSFMVIHSRQTPSFHFMFSFFLIHILSTVVFYPVWWKLEIAPILVISEIIKGRHRSWLSCCLFTFLLIT